MSSSFNSIILWHHVSLSGIVFTLVLLILLALRHVSLLNVIGNACLGLLTTTLAFRVYRASLSIINRDSNNTHHHPFTNLLESDLTLSMSGIHETLDLLCLALEWMSKKMRSSILIQEPKESIIFAFLMYCLTYVGQYVTALTLFTILWTALFTLPKLYDVHRSTIDKAVLPVSKAIKELVAKIDFDDNNNNNNEVDGVRRKHE